MTMPTSSGLRASVPLQPGGRVPRARGAGPDDPAAADTITARDVAVARALEAAIKDGDRVADLLDALTEGRLWVPLPDDGTPVTDGSSLTLPIVTYLGGEFVPAFTSLRELKNYPAGSGQAEPRLIPHVVVPAAELARSLPADVGIALNPGAEASVPVYPAGVAYLAAVEGQAEGVRIRVSRPPREPARLLSEASARLRAVPAVREARAAWLSVAGRGEGLIIAIDLDNPADEADQDAAARAVERAAALVTDEGFAIDVTFASSTEPNPVAEAVAASAAPFYRRP